MLWRNGQAIDLNSQVTAPAILYYAVDINNRGWIVAQAGTSSQFLGAYVLVPPSVEIVAPVDGQTVRGDSTFTIEWEAPAIDSVRILVSTDVDPGGGGGFHEVARVEASHGEWEWEVPDTVATRCAILIEDTTNPNVGDQTGAFRIRSPWLARTLGGGALELFRPEVHGFAFDNDTIPMWPAQWYSQFEYQDPLVLDPYTGLPYPQVEPAFLTAIASEFPDWPLFVRTFGPAACYESAAAGLYEPSALSRWIHLREPWDGSCSGFSSAALLDFLQPLFLSQQFPALPQHNGAHDLSADDSVRVLVNQYQLYSFSSRILFLDLGIIGNVPLVGDIEARLLQDDPDFAPLGFFDPRPGGGGHSVVPYRISRDPENPSVRKIAVYDPRTPDTTQILTIDLSTGTWSYPPVGWGGDSFLEFAPRVSTIMGHPTPPMKTTSKGSVGRAEAAGARALGMTADELHAHFWMRNDSTLFIGSAAGEIVFQGDSLINTIPGARPIYKRTSRPSAPRQYRLPLDTYRIEAGWEPDATRIYGVEDESALQTIIARDGGGGDTLHYGDGLAYVGGAPGREILWRTIAILPAEERVWTMTTAATSQADSIHVRMAGGDWSVHSGGGARSYSLSLQRVGGGQGPTFAVPSMPIDAGDTHRLLVDWTAFPEGLLAIEVDRGSDGVPDDTIGIAVTGVGDGPRPPSDPARFGVGSPAPNPFRSVTTVEASLPQPGRVRVAVYDASGRLVRRLPDEHRRAGVVRVEWNGQDDSGRRLAAGIYHLRLEVQPEGGGKSRTETRRVTLLR
jgi:hypothetical protein